MCIGNTDNELSVLVFSTVYPYVYREHQSISDAVKSGIGLSLCV